ncbi:MAG: UDP-N-acetylmuramoyl-L-alanyl-D-glutamate--2,6-diaminopimelate ligase [Pseudomonadota bacterium]
MSTSMHQLCQRLGVQPAGVDVEISRVELDSRRVGPGVLFVACRGATASSADGHDFIDAAIAAGASAVLAEHLVRTPAVAHAVVSDSRRALAILAEELAGNPSHSLRLAGITGTNGKTTVVHMTAAALESAGTPCASLGTLGLEFAGEHTAWLHTTPEATELSGALARLRQRGARAVAMEVSSHALSLKRVEGLHFAVAAFTNLSQDHLDFHGDMASYFDAKRRLFDELLPADARAVCCVDDAAGRELAESLRSRALRVGTGDQPELDLAVREARLTPHGTEVTLRVGGTSLQALLPQVGRFNLANALVALGVAHALEQPLAAALDGIARCPQVPGRLEQLAVAGCPRVFVDYSHTPQALELALATLQELSGGRVVVVFGCGGERDAGKRPLMGRIAASGADAVVITDDNPRREDPQQITAAILEGARSVQTPRAGHIEIERDRQRAIARAIALAAVDDIVLIAGKGHEDYQEVAGQRRHFNDREVALEILEGRAA